VVAGVSEDEDRGNTWLLSKEWVGQDERSGSRRRALTRFPCLALGGIATLLERFKRLRAALDGTAALLERSKSELLRLALGGTTTLLESRGFPGGTVITR
jgi:hypothetical protein